MTAAAVTPIRVDPASRPLTPPSTGAGRLALYSFWKTLTNPYSLGFAIAMPILMYSIFGTGQSYSDIWVGHANVAGTVLASMALYGAMMTTSSMGANVALERTSGVTRLFALTPLSPLVQILARITAAMGISAVVISVTYAYGAVNGTDMEAGAWLGSALLVIVLSVLPAALGLAAGFAMRSDSAFAVTSLLTVLGSFMSGMFIPLDSMGRFFQHLAPWTPFYGTVKLIQLPLTGDSLDWVWILNVVVWTAVFAGVAAWGQSRDTGR